MSVDRAKALEAATKHVGKGNYDRAIAELRKIVQEDPSDVRTWLKIGDLYTRKGARKEAIETYCRVAEQYAGQGFFLKAVAVYKQILKLDPSRLDIQLRLAEMYEMLQLVSDALSTYEHVAAGYARSGDIERALSTLRKMTELDPENIPVRIKCAEALSKAGKTKDAAEEFEAGAKLLEEQGRIDDYIKVAERLLFHRPDDVATARKLAGLYLERDDPKRALSKLQLCFKADPKDLATLELLAEAFRQLGQLPKTISVLKEVARIHQEAGRHDERARILKRILELDPADQEARQGMASFAGSVASGRRDIQPPASAVVEPSRRPPPPDSAEVEIEPASEADIEMIAADEMEVLEVDDDEEIIIVEEEVESVDSLEAVGVPEAISEPPSGSTQSDGVQSGSVPPDVQREAQIARLLTECEVFLRYGLKQKVADQLRAVIQLDPAHVEAHERLKDLHLEEGRVDDAVDVLWRLAGLLAEEQSAASVLYLRQILEIDPEHVDARGRLTQLGASIPPPAARAVTPSPSQDELPPAVEPTAEDADEIFFLDDETDSGSAEELAIAVDEVPAASLDALDDERAPSTATDAAPLGDTPPPSRQAMMPPPSADSASPGQPGLMDPLAPMSPAEFEEVPLRPSTPGEVRAEASQRLSLPPGEVEELLDEADFFIAQGLLEEARGTLSDGLTQFPDHPLVLDKLREVGQLASQAEVARTSAELDLADQSFELAEKLAEEFEDVSDDTVAGSDVLDVEQVFAQFKKGVEAQVGIEDSETHFDLGIAYKEMGLLDDAINEFRLCLTNPSRVCIAETMIGLCHIEKGEVAEGIGHFKKGLYADTKSEREELGLYFELGHAYELLHDPKEALYYYQKVQKRDPGFRNVDRRIDGLTQPKAAPESAPAIAQDDIDRAFDDLMGED